MIVYFVSMIGINKFINLKKLASLGDRPGLIFIINYYYILFLLSITPNLQACTMI